MSITTTKTIIPLSVLLLIAGMGLFVRNSTRSSPDSHGTVVMGHKIDRIVFGNKLIQSGNMPWCKEDQQVYFRIENRKVISNIQSLLGAEIPSDAKGFVNLGGYLTQILLYNDGEEVFWIEVNADGETLLIEDMETTESYVLFNRNFALYAFSLMEQNAKGVLSKFKEDKSGLYQGLIDAFPFDDS